MYHLRRIPRSEWPLQVRNPPHMGGTREAQYSDLLNMGIRVEGKDADYIYIAATPSVTVGEKIPFSGVPRAKRYKHKHAGKHARRGRWLGEPEK